MSSLEFEKVLELEEITENLQNSEIVKKIVIFSEKKYSKILIVPRKSTWGLYALILLKRKGSFGLKNWLKNRIVPKTAVLSFLYLCI